MSGSALTTLKIRFDLELGDPVLFNQYQRQYNSYFRTFRDFKLAESDSKEE